MVRRGAVLVGRRRGPVAAHPGDEASPAVPVAERRRRAAPPGRAAPTRRPSRLVRSAETARMVISTAWSVALPSSSHFHIVIPHPMCDEADDDVEVLRPGWTRPRHRRGRRAARTPSCTATTATRAAGRRCRSRCTPTGSTSRAPGPLRPGDARGARRDPLEPQRSAGVPEDVPLVLLGALLGDETLAEALDAPTDASPTRRVEATTEPVGAHLSRITARLFRGKGLCRAVVRVSMGEWTGPGSGTQVQRPLRNAWSLSVWLQRLPRRR